MPSSPSGGQLIGVLGQLGVGARLRIGRFMQSDLLAVAEEIEPGRVNVIPKRLCALEILGGGREVGISQPLVMGDTIFPGDIGARGIDLALRCQDSLEVILFLDPAVRRHGDAVGSEQDW